MTCVPYLAPLLKGYVRDFRSTSDRRYYYDSNGRGYIMENFSKTQNSHLRSNVSAPSQPKRTPSEELILASREPSHGGIEMTVEYRVEEESRRGSSRG